MTRARPHPSERAGAVVKGLLRTGRAKDPRASDGYVRVACQQGGFYWVSLDGARALRGEDFVSAAELQPGFVAAMERAGR